MTRILFVLNDGPFFVSHRLPVARAAQAAGVEVHLAAPGTAPDEVVAAGIVFHPLTLSRQGANPLAEAWALVSLIVLMARLRPALVHAVTIKPVLYGGIAARLTGVGALVAAISGLGAVFNAEGRRARLRRAIVLRLYRLALGHRRLRVIFQNPDDRALFVEHRLVAPQRTVLIPGSGVPLEDFPARAMPPGPPVFVLAARLLVDKGVREFVAAARLLHARGVPARFVLLGATDPGNPTAIPQAELDAWHAEGVVDVPGPTSDIPAAFARAHVVVLPSYREGLPRVLAEAAAAGRAVITTDAPGCRDAVLAGRSGLLVPARDVPALADAMARLAADPALREAMGRAGRRLAEEKFAIQSIVGQHMHVYRALGLKV